MNDSIRPASDVRSAWQRLEDRIRQARSDGYNMDGRFEEAMLRVCEMSSVILTRSTSLEAKTQLFVRLFEEQVSALDEACPRTCSR